VEPRRARDPEVGDVDAVVLAEEQVRRLHVAMHDPARVRGVERAGRLVQPLERAAERLCSLTPDPVRQRAARQVLHHDVRPSLVLADVVDRDGAGRIREACGSECLPREAPPDRNVPRQVLREDLDRDGACEIGVLGPVDLAHAAAGDPFRISITRG
jgi:hypothetical protein